MIHSMILPEMIQAGSPVMVLAPHGVGRYHYTREAIKKRGLTQHDFYISAAWNKYNDDPSKTYTGYGEDGSFIGFNAFLKSIPGNGVLVIHNINHITPVWVVPILIQMNHPDLPVVLIGSSCEYPTLINRSRIVKLSNEIHFP